jgi:hypothetical protein
MLTLIFKSFSGYPYLPNTLFHKGFVPLALFKARSCFWLNQILGRKNEAIHSQ